MPFISTLAAASARAFGFLSKLIPGGSGLYGRRYSGYMNDNPNFFLTATLSGTSKVYTNINSNWTEGGNDFSIEWLGYFKTDGESGSWQFRTDSDDCSYLWIGNEVITQYSVPTATVNNGGVHGPVSATGSKVLQSNTYYPIRIQFGELSGGEVMAVYFAKPSAPTSWINDGTGYFFYNTSTLGY
jgi:hypothetical protein